MKKFLIWFVLILQMGIGMAMAQEFPDSIEIHNIELEDSSLIRAIEETVKIANAKVVELEERQKVNNAIINHGNYQIAEINKNAGQLATLVHAYFAEHDTTQRQKLLEFLETSYKNDTVLAVIVNEKVKKLEEEGRIIDLAQQQSIAQNRSDKQLCEDLIENWQRVMRGMRLMQQKRGGSWPKRPFKKPSNKLGSSVTKF